MSEWEKHRTADLPTQQNIHRLRQYRRFIGVQSFPSSSRVLDVGAANFISRSLGISDNTSGDLNEIFITRKRKYDIITCFEVINHIFNHGVLLENISTHLAKDGKLYLGTPLSYGLGMPHGRGNYVEITKRSMRAMLEYKGFKILRYETHMSYPFRHIFNGILQPFRAVSGKHFEDGIHAPKMQWKYFGLRPIIKYLLHRYQLYECVKAQ